MPAGYINAQMPHFEVEKVVSALNDHSKPLRGSHVHIVGVTYKRDIIHLLTQFSRSRLCGCRGRIYSTPTMVRGIETRGALQN
jgi:hypothetical protein